MRILLGIVVFVASLGAVAVTMRINAAYQFGQGASPSEAEMRALAMVVFDCLKAGLPVGISMWWLRRQWSLVAIGTTTFAFCFVMSLFSAIGFYATNRASVSQNREGTTVRYRVVKRELNETAQRLGEFGTVRPADVVESALQALRTDKRYLTSKSCVDATALASREFCRDYFTAEGELATAREVQRLQNRREALQSTVEQLLQAGAEKDVDPQATALSRLLPFLKLQDVKLGVDLLPSVLLELVASFGLLLTTGMMQRPSRGAVADDAMPAKNAKLRAGVKAPNAGRKPLTFKVCKDGSYVIDC